MIWSTPMWNLYHTLSEKCEDNIEKRQKVYLLIQKLSVAIPCGICKIHAVSYLFKEKKPIVFESRDNFNNFFYDFHNQVKKTRNLSLESKDVLEKYKSMDLNKMYREVLEMLILFGMPDDFTKKINDLYLENFSNLEGGVDINREYVKDPHNKKRILKRLGIKTKTINKKDLEITTEEKETKKKDTLSTLKSMLIVGGGLLMGKSKGIFKKNS